MHYIYSLFIFWFIFTSVWVTFADEWEQVNCKYQSQFEQCVVANKNGSARSIQDFICAEERDPNKVLDQIIIDLEFTKIDTEIETYLRSIENDKNRSVYEPNVLIDEIVYNLSREWYYYKQYKKLCQWWLLSERLSCSEVIPNTVGSTYLDGGNFDSRVCMTLVDIKMDALGEVVQWIIKLNKSTVLIDNKQLYKQEEKTRYDVLLDLIRAILGFLERFANGITHWTPNPYQGS